MNKTQRLDIHDRLERFLELAQAGDVYATDAVRPLLHPVPGWKAPADLHTFNAVAVRDELLGLVRRVAAGEKVRFYTTIARQLWHDKRIREGLLTSTSADHVRDLTIHRLASFLEAMGIGRLRRCKADDCSRLFMKATRKEFCSTRCQSRVWMREERRKNRGTGHGAPRKK